MRYLVGAVLAVVMLLPHRLSANEMQGIILRQDDAPVRISRCYGYSDIGLSSNAAVSFYNVARDQALRRIWFSFETLDVDSRVLGSVELVESGTFDPGVVITPPRDWFTGMERSQIHWQPGALDWYRIRCGVMRAQFANGSIWIAPKNELHPWNPNDVLFSRDLYMQ